MFCNSFLHVMDTPHSSYMLDNGDFTVTVQLIIYSPYFIEPEYSLPYSQEPTNASHYPQADESTPYPFPHCI
jgi:hypothetical protein